MQIPYWRHLLAVVCLWVVAAPVTAAISVDANFENGHLGKHVIKNDDTLEIGPLNGNRERWFSFRIKGVKNRRVTFVVEWLNRAKVYIPNYNGALNDKAMVTYDGQGYEIIKDHQLAPKDPRQIAGDFFTGNWTQTFSHVFREEEAQVAYATPYTNTDLAALAERLQADPRVTVGSIGPSQLKKLPVTYFRITDPAVPDAGKTRFFMTGREDAYEVARGPHFALPARATSPASAKSFSVRSCQPDVTNYLWPSTPAFDLGMFVRGIVVHAQVQVEFRRGLGVDQLQELDPFLMAVPGHAGANQLARPQHQTGGSGAAFGPTRRH